MILPRSSFGFRGSIGLKPIGRLTYFLATHQIDNPDHRPHQGQQRGPAAHQDATDVTKDAL